MKLPDESAYAQAAELMRAALAMHQSVSPEWLAFLELVKAMREKQRGVSQNKLYSKREAEKAERLVDNILEEFAECSAPVTLNFEALTQPIPLKPTDEDEE